MDRASEERFAQWMISRGPTMQRFAFLLCGDWQIAEDLVQEAFARCALRWAQMEQIDNPDGYVRTVVINQCRSHWRLRKARPDHPVEAIEDRQAEDATAGQAERAEMLAALRRLPARQRAVVVCRYYEGLSEAEIAALLGCSLGTVKSQCHKALRSLRGMIELERQHADR